MGRRLAASDAGGVARFLRAGVIVSRDTVRGAVAIQSFRSSHLDASATALEKLDPVWEAPSDGR